MNCEFISKIRQFNLLFSMRVRKKTCVCLRNACVRIYASNKIPTRLQCKNRASKDVFFTVKSGSVRSGIRRRLEGIVDSILELDVYKRRKELGNDVTYF